MKILIDSIAIRHNIMMGERTQMPTSPIAEERFDAAYEALSDENKNQVAIRANQLRY